eukprot:scaffold253161_cov23-Tisochrysis_lutea.AAC.5
MPVEVSRPPSPAASGAGASNAMRLSRARSNAERMQVPTMVEDIALPARSAIWSLFSRVSSRSSIGMPWSASTSGPTMGPPRFVR